MADIQTILDRLQANISAVQSNPQTALDVKLFEEAELVLPRRINGNDLLGLIRQLSILLPQLQQDPSPPVNLLTRLLDDFTFADVLAFDPPVDFTAGLQIGEHMVAFNRLILYLLSKAALKASDAAIVASQPETLLALVRLWLCTPDTGVASKSSAVLVDLLKVDQAIQQHPDAHLPSGGQGLVWKRLFGDHNVYATFFDVCSMKPASTVDLGKKERTLAQARLMEWLPSIGRLDWTIIAHSQHPDVETKYGVSGGLLEFTASKMVDFKDDVLMYRCLIDFYSDLLDATKPSPTEAVAVRTSPALEYLIQSGVHDRTAAIFLQKPSAQLDLVEAMFLYGPAANYVATYSSLYPKHFLSSPMFADVKKRLMTAFSISPSKWAHGDSPKHDLHVAASLPRAALLPGESGAGDWSQTPLSLLPSKSTNPDVLNTLATVFHGPSKEMIIYPAESPVDDEGDSAEAAGARAIYFHYVANNPRFWSDIAAHADTVALKELALAALNCLISVITANWSTKPTLGLPSTIATPESGHLAILSPPALEYALPYLLNPPKTFANLVGGRGDAESAAYKIASAKYDALRLLHSRLMTQVEAEPGQGYEEILATIAKRLADGPLSRTGEVGGRIGTMDL